MNSLFFQPKKNYLQFFNLNRYEHVAKRNEDASKRGRKLFSKGDSSNFKVLSGEIRTFNQGKASKNKEWLEFYS